MRLHALLAAILFLAVALAAKPARAADRTLTLNEAIEMALERNEDLVVAACRKRNYQGEIAPRPILRRCRGCRRCERGEHAQEPMPCATHGPDFPGAPLGRSGTTEQTGENALRGEAFAAAAGLGCIRIVEAQAPRKPVLHYVESRALDMGKAGRIDGNADAVVLEDDVLRSDRFCMIHPVPVTRAARGLNRKPHGHSARTLRELRSEVPRGRCTEHNGARSLPQRCSHPQRLVLRNLDDEIALAADRLAGKARAWLERRCLVQDVPLVFGCCPQALEPFAHDDAAGSACERATAVVRKLDAVPQQAVEEIFAFGEAQFQCSHMDRTSPAAARFSTACERGGQQPRIGLLAS